MLSQRLHVQYQNRKIVETVTCCRTEAAQPALLLTTNTKKRTKRSDKQKRKVCCIIIGPIQTQIQNETQCSFAKNMNILKPRYKCAFSNFSFRLNGLNMHFL